MKKELIFLVILIFYLSFTSADTFTIVSGQGGFSFGGVSGNQIGGITGIPVVTVPSPPTSVSGPSGGGGIRSINPIQNLIVNPIAFNLPAAAGIKSSGKILLRNLRNNSLNLIITFSGTNNLIQFDLRNLTLQATETRILDFSINPPAKAGIYSGEIIFSTAAEQTSVPVVVNVGEGQSLFDIAVNIPEQYRFIQPGGNLTSQISLTQIGVQKETDVTLSYIIKDFKGNVYEQTTETIAVYKQKIFEKTFDVSNLSSGDYLLGIEAIYSGGVATSSAQFTIVSPGEVISKTPEINIFLLSIGTFIFLGLLFSFFIVLVIVLIIKIRKSRRIWRV